ncbi:ankyrin [Wilcoxina mikolae CBS 423.85]|nr:ankyrin [Wilcoxina mikolae CBS 423.85]
MMEDISTGQPWARKVLSWILFSFRPLKCVELGIALAADSARILEDIPSDIEGDIQRVFGPLVDTESGDVRLVHPSFRDFLLDSKGQWYSFETPHKEHAVLVTACLKYLSQQSSGENDSEKGRFVQYVNDKAELRTPVDRDTSEFPFLSYATWYWEQHYQAHYRRGQGAFVDIQLRDEVMRFLTSKHIREWCLFRRYLESPKSSKTSYHGVPLEHAAELGLADIVREILGNDKEITDNQKARALCLAVENGYSEAANHILSSIPNTAVAGPEETVAESKGDVVKSDGSTPEPVSHKVVASDDITAVGKAMERAAMRGYDSILTLLLAAREKGDISSSDITDLNLGAALSLAARYGHRNAAAKLLDARVDVNIHLAPSPLSGFRIGVRFGKRAYVQVAGFEPPLFNAASNGHYAVVDLLINRGADVSIAGPGNRTPLMAAASNGQAVTLRQLLDHGAEINTCADGGFTAIHFAAQNGHLEIVRKLLDKGADLEAISEEGQTALHLSCDRGWLSVVAELLKRGANINATDKKGDIPVHIAARKGHICILEALADSGAKISFGNTLKSTPLHCAAEEGQHEAVKKLLELGANIDACDKSRDRPLHIAARFGRSKVVTELLQGGAFEDSQNQRGSTPLVLGASGGYVEVVDALLAAGANPNLKNSSDFAPIHWSYQEPWLVRKLKNAGADVDLIGGRQWTPINFAAANGNNKATKELLELGADPAICNDFGYNSLQNAVDGKHLDIVKLIIEEGRMDPFATGLAHQQRPPLLMASHQKSQPIVDYLVLSGIQNHNDRLILHMAAAGLVAQLASINCKDLNLDFVDVKNRQPLFYAAASQNTDTIKFFLDRKQDKAWKDKSGRIPFDVAFSREVRDILSEPQTESKAEASRCDMLTGEPNWHLVKCEFCEKAQEGFYYHCCLCYRCQDVCIACYDGGKRCSGDHGMTKRYIEDHMVSVAEYSDWVERMELPLSE